jgi:hypothetical protein
MTVRSAAALATAVLSLSNPPMPPASASPRIPIRPFVTGRDRTVTLVLASEDQASVFTIDPAETTLSLRSLDHQGLAIRVSPSERGKIVAVAPPPGSPLMEFTERTPIAALTFPLTASVAPGMYDANVSYAGDSRLRLDNAFPSQIYVSTAQRQPDTGLVQARRDYVGKVVYLMSATQWFNQLACSSKPQPPTPNPTSSPLPQPSGTVSPTEMMQRLRAFAEEPVRRHDFMQVGALRGSAWRVISVGRLTTAQDGYFSNSDADFLAIEPLEAFLIPLADQPSAMGGSDPADVREYLKSCETFVRAFADPWELKRTLFATSPFDHPEWPKEFQAAVTAGTVLPGMTHEMVANIFGYPSVYGSIEQLDRMSVWDYDEPAPWGPTITFRGDRVVRYDPGSAPP